jgi:hypothetical protein
MNDHEKGANGMQAAAPEDLLNNTEQSNTADHPVAQGDLAPQPLQPLDPGQPKEPEAEHEQQLDPDKILHQEEVDEEQEKLDHAIITLLRAKHPLDDTGIWKRLVKSGDLDRDLGHLFEIRDRIEHLLVTGAIPRGWIETYPRIERLKLDDIVIPDDRLRALNKDKVADLAKSIEDGNLIQPIEVLAIPKPEEEEEDGKEKDGEAPVSYTYTLVTGRHRLEAARRLRWKTIPCIILDDLSHLDLVLREIDENLIRAELASAERDALTARRVKLVEEMQKNRRLSAIPPAPRQGQGKGGGRKTGVSHTAKLTGRSKSSVREAAQMNKAIPRLAETAGTSLGSTRERRALAKLPDEQNELIDRAKAGEEVSALKVLEQKTAPTNTEKQVKPKKGAPQKDSPMAQAEKDLMAAVEVIIDTPNGLKPSHGTLKFRQAAKKLTSFLPSEKTAKLRPEQLFKRGEDAVADMDAGTRARFLEKVAKQCGFELKAVAGPGGEQ